MGACCNETAYVRSCGRAIPGAASSIAFGPLVGLKEARADFPNSRHTGSRICNLDMAHDQSRACLHRQGSRSAGIVR